MSAERYPILGGPVAPMTEEARSHGRSERIDSVVLIIAKVVGEKEARVRPTIAAEITGAIGSWT